MAALSAQHEFAGSTIGGNAIVQQGDRRDTNTVNIEIAYITLQVQLDLPRMGKSVNTSCAHGTEHEVHVRNPASGRRTLKSEFEDAHDLSKHRDRRRSALMTNKRPRKLIAVALSRSGGNTITSRNKCAKQKPPEVGKARYLSKIRA